MYRLLVLTSSHSSSVLINLKRSLPNLTKHNRPMPIWLVETLNGCHYSSYGSSSASITWPKKNNINLQIQTGGSFVFWYCSFKKANLTRTLNQGTFCILFIGIDQYMNVLYFFERLAIFSCLCECVCMFIVCSFYNCVVWMFVYAIY